MKSLFSVGAILLLALLLPLAAAARPVPDADAQPAFSLVRPPSYTGAHLTVSSFGSAPANARAGHTYLLHETLLNDGSAAARARLAVQLMRVGSRPLAIGSTAVHIAAHGSRSFGVRARLPHVLRDGSYALVACARRAGGALGCATAERHLEIGTASRVSAVREGGAAPSGTCSSGAHSLSPF